MTDLIYVCNADGGSISVLALDAQRGSLHPLQTLDAGDRLAAMCLSPEATSPDTRTGRNPDIGRAGRWLHVARRSDPATVLSYAVDAATGLLSLQGTAPLPADMVYLHTDRQGRWLFSASYTGDVLAVSPIGRDGLPGPAQQVLDTGRHAHGIGPDLRNRFVFAPVLGTDEVLQFRFDAATGRLTPQVPPALAVHAGAGPRHLVLHPNGRQAYLLNELDASLDVLALDAEHGTLRHLSTQPFWPGAADAGSGVSTGAPWAADLHLTPDARFLYTSERRTSTLAGFAVSADGARLTPLGHWPTQAQPRGFAVSPGGGHLIVAGQLSNQVSVHAIDPDTGHLRAVHTHAVGRGPMWVEVLRLG